MPVDSFNTRTGDVVLNASDVTGALDFIPESAGNKSTSALTASLTKFPVEKVVKDYVDTSIPTGVFSNNVFTQI
jgi:hypothetical protein